ncbi:hypothetical protein [Amycolatopsis sp. cmx-4-68]|uniref:hypothetical protein n=1 Tax=Amycolatopsis sp. cmx-4-68 TaxID=2790938 RepID=UPI00397B9CA0
MRRLRSWWVRGRGWWLLAAAATATAVLAALGRAYPGTVAAAAVAAGGVAAAVLSERGKAHLTAKSTPKQPVYVSRVDRITDPIRLGVHPAAALARDDGSVDRVPPFVPRDRSAELAEALGRGGFVLIVGDSTAGKTRLAYETLRSCLPRHTCVVPEGPDALSAAVAAAKQHRPSVLWLDDLERYLLAGGLVRTDLDALTAGRVVVLATLRAHERARFSRRHDVEREADDRQQARAGRDALDAVTREIRLERRWSERELATARAFRDDTRIAAALAGTVRHGVAEHLAAGPELVRELQDAWAPGSGRARGAALVTAAVDVRRARYHRPLPVPLLRELHDTYLDDRGGAALRPEAWEEALAWATQPLHATSSLLEPDARGDLLAFDYLLDHASRNPAQPPVPDVVWDAVLAHAGPDDLVPIAWEASFAGRLDQVERALDRAMAAGEPVAAAAIATCLGDAGRETTAAGRLTEIIADATASGDVAGDDLRAMRHDLAWMVGEGVAGRGDARRALRLAEDVARDTAVALGDLHPSTLHAELTVARQLGSLGAEAEALALAERVAADATRTHGADHELTLNARFEVAVWTVRTAGPAAGAQRFAALIDQLVTLPKGSPALLADSRWNLGGALLDSGEVTRAVEVLATAVAEAGRAFGPHHRRTFDTRMSHVEAVAAAGDVPAARAMAAELAAECVRRLGEDNATTRDAVALAKRWP